MCRKCKEFKSLTCFGKRSATKSGLDYYCKPCRSAASKDYATRHPDKIKAKQEALKVIRAAKPKRPILTEAERRKRKLECEQRRYLKRPELIKANAKRWAKNNPHKVAANNAKRRAAKRSATVPWASQRYIELWYEIARLETARTGVPCHVDHIVPLVHPLVCGLHCEENMQVLTASDNCAKQNRFKTDWE